MVPWCLWTWAVRAKKYARDRGPHDNVCQRQGLNDRVNRRRPRRHIGEDRRSRAVT